MARTLAELGLALGYNSAEADLVSDFYVPCLDVADRYDRAVGYFRSSVYHLVGVALSDFALRGGHMRMVSSPGLTEDDRRIMEAEAAVDRVVSQGVEREISGILSHPENLPVVELLATLLAWGALEVKIAYRPGETGIFHEKLGVFFSVGDRLSFSGSANETFMAWDARGNHEGFETFGSWDSADLRRVNRHAEYFESLWTDQVQGLRVVQLPDVPQSVLSAHVNPEGLEAAVEKARDHLRRVGRTRSAPRRLLQPHQASVVQNWLAQERGIIDHVTGAGKTVSALEILRRWLTADRIRCAIVLVPSNLLSQQWYREVDRELADMRPRLLFVGGTFGQSDWRSSVSSFTARLPLGPRLIIATMQSASSDEFMQRVQVGDHLLLVADEVHKLGSPRHKRILGLAAKGRLGLSATPGREGDPEGTWALFDYFGPILAPPFGIPQAQKAGRLVPYDYYVDTVDLDDDEETEYRRLTRRIIELRASVQASSSLEERERLDLLRIQRARIVKKARQKIPFTLSLLGAHFSSGERWLVYCEDSDQLRVVREGLAARGLEVLEYHSQMVGDPPATLRSFETYGGILVSIRCLDEGIDIPLVDHALILASSTNSREYIQRRGRVLRTAPGKYSAEVYDILVCRDVDSKREVLNRDYERARRFAEFARNDSCRYRLDMLRSATEDSAVQFEEERGDVAW